VKTSSNNITVDTAFQEEMKGIMNSPNKDNMKNIISSILMQNWDINSSVNEMRELEEGLMYYNFELILDYFFEKIKSLPKKDRYLYKEIILELSNNKNEEIKKRILDLLDKSFSKNCVNLDPDSIFLTKFILNTWNIEKNEIIEKQTLNLLNKFFKENIIVDISPFYVRSIIDLLNYWYIKKTKEIEDQTSELLNKCFEIIKNCFIIYNIDFVINILNTWYVKKNKETEKKVLYLLDRLFDKFKNWDFSCVEQFIWLLKSWLKNWYVKKNKTIENQISNFLNIKFEKTELYLNIVLVIWLLDEPFIQKNKNLKKWFLNLLKKYLESCLEKINSDKDLDNQYLLNIKILLNSKYIYEIEEIEKIKENIINLLHNYLKNSRINYCSNTQTINCNFNSEVISEISDTIYIDENEIKEKYLESLDYCICKSLEDTNYGINVIKLLKIWILNKYDELLINKLERFLYDYIDESLRYPFYLEIIKEILNLWLINKTKKLKKWFLNLFNKYFEEYKNWDNSTDNLIKLLDTWGVDKSKEVKEKMLYIFNTFIKRENLNSSSEEIIKLLNTWYIDETKEVKEKTLRYLNWYINKYHEDDDINASYPPIFYKNILWLLSRVSNDINICIDSQQFNEKYQENLKLYNKIFENLDKNFKILNYLQKNLLNTRKLEDLLKFTEYKINKIFFIENMEKITSHPKWIYFWYFIELIINEREIEKNNTENFPITRENFLDFMNEDDVLLIFEKDQWFRSDWIIPWTKAWFLEKPERKEYLKPETIKTFKKFGTIIWLWVVEWSQNPETLKEFYEYIFTNISPEKSRSSILQLWEVFNLILKKEEYNIFNELVGNKINIWDKFKNFIEENKISDKWRTILTLMITREINHSFSIFKNKDWKEEIDSISLEKMLLSVFDKFTKYEKEINKYKNLPIQTSIWIEYEITESIVNWYKKITNSDYVNDIEILSEYSSIGKWVDSVYEIATKPTDNPYLVLLELKLLEDLDFIDLNFKKEYYKEGSRWLHISMWWEHWIKLDQNANFIQNILLASNLWTINMWDFMIHKDTYSNTNRIKKDRWDKWEITDIKVDVMQDFDYIRKRNNSEVLFWDEETDCVEYRWLLINKKEPFERLILSIFNLNMVKQAMDKYLLTNEDELETNENKKDKDWNIEIKTKQNQKNYDNMEKLNNLMDINTVEEFKIFIEKNSLLKEKIKDERNYKLIFEFLKLKKKTKEIIINNNENFLENETISLKKEEWLSKLLLLLTSTW
jgi:hypothetical protein